MIKEIRFSSEGREKILEGVDIVCNAVKTSLGAAGRTTIIGFGYDGFAATKDGVSIARSIMVKDPLINIGCMLAKEASVKTVETAGDGTTSAAILLQAIIHGGVKAIDEGANPVELKKGIEKAVEGIVATLKNLSRPVETKEELIQIATISANNDAEIGQLIAECVHSVGKDGLITVEDSKNHETYTDTVEGMKFDRGFASPFFVTDQGKMRCEMENPLILVCDKRIQFIKEVLDFIQNVNKLHPNKPLLLIVDNIEGEALSFFTENKSKGLLNVCVVKAPEFGTNRKNTLQDIATIVGGTFVSDERGMSINKTNPKDLGEATKVIVDKDSTLIIGGKGNALDIEERCNSIRNSIESSDSEEETKQLKARLARMLGKVALLKVGAITTTESKEKKDRIDDALCATRAANEEGYLSGGGTAFIECLHFGMPSESLNEDQKKGWAIVYDAIVEPFRQLLFNAGIEHKAHLSTIMNARYGTGFNVKTEKIENLFDAGVIDPTKVARCAIENAGSLAGIFLTTECVVSDPIPNDQKSFTLTTDKVEVDVSMKEKSFWQSIKGLFTSKN